MKGPEAENLSLMPSPSANEQFHRKWEAYWGWSTAVAIVAHLAMFALSPTWNTEIEEEIPASWEGSRLLALPFFGQAPSLRQAPATPLALAQGADEDQTEPITQEGSTATSLDRGDLWDAVGERRKSGGRLTPSIAEPDIEPAEESASEDTVSEQDNSGVVNGGHTEIGGRHASTTDLIITELQDSLRLDRLSALRPDLAFMAASAWVLIRNPIEVENFMGRGYREGSLDPSIHGTVSVTLWIDRGGSVEWAEVVESSGTRDLDEYALELFNEVAEFRPARERGVTISRSVTLLVQFPW